MLATTQGMDTYHTSHSTLSHTLFTHSHRTCSSETLAPIPCTAACSGVWPDVGVWGRLVEVWSGSWEAPGGVRGLDCLSCPAAARALPCLRARGGGCERAQGGGSDFLCCRVW